MLTNKLPKGFKFTSDEEIEKFFRSDEQIMRHIRKLTRTAVRQDILKRVKQKKPINNRFFYAFATYDPVDGQELTPHQEAYMWRYIEKWNERDPID